MNTASDNITSVTMDQFGLFPTFNPVSPTTRQTTRALQEIQSQRPNLLIVDGDDDIDITPLPMHPIDITDRMRWTANFDDSMVTPNPSPDEMVIQARGRRQIPLTFSPDINHTPLRQQIQRAKLSALAQSPTRTQPSRLMLPSSKTRCSPRKRLTLNDSPPSSNAFSTLSSLYSPSPDKLKRSPLAKKMRLDHTGNSSLKPEVAIKGLSHAQLTDLIGSLMSFHPELRTEVASLLPTPDLSHYEESLNYLKKNIYKALPSSRLETKTDSLAYNRVSVHLLAFKKAVCEGMKTLIESQQWLSAIDYTVMAWGYVKATPVWSNPPHNNVRKTCFKTLATSCMRALKEGNFKADQWLNIKGKLEKLKSESDEILVCVKYIDFIMSNGNNNNV